MVARRPDALFHAQFWAEDGTLWYRDAYQIGISAFLHPALGYLQTVSRLTAFIAVQFPLACAPTIYAIIALYFQVLPAGIWLSKRLDKNIVSWPGRIAVAYFYAVIPNSYEWNMNITNTQWHLALAAFLIIIGSPTEGVGSRLADTVIVLLSGLSGPFSIFYAPFAAWEYRRERTKQKAAILTITVICAAIQALSLLTTLCSRPLVHLDASFSTLCKILTDQILLGGLVGAHLTNIIIMNPFFGSAWAAVSLTLCAMAVTIIALKIGPPAYVKMFLFIGLLLISSLIRPASQANTWDEMAQLGNCDRYFIGPILVWFSTLIVLLGSKLFVRKMAMSLLFVSFFGIIGDFHYPIFDPTNFTSEAIGFAGAKVGTVVVFPENPLGWSMVLTKRSG